MITNRRYIIYFKDNTFGMQDVLRIKYYLHVCLNEFIDVIIMGGGGTALLQKIVCLIRCTPRCI